MSIISFVLALMLTGCHSPCEKIYYGGDAPGLLQFSPLQSVYNQGDVVVVRCSLPSVSNYFYSGELNVYDVTKLNNIKSYIIFEEFFQGNQCTFTKGGFVDGNFSWINLPYNVDTDSYDMEVTVKLNRQGSYDFYPYMKLTDFNDNTCRGIDLRATATVDESSTDGNIRFTVQ